MNGSLRAGLRRDAGRGALAAAGALAAIALVELLATVVTYTGPLRALAVLRLVPLDLTLVGLGAVPAVAVAAVLACGPRLLVRATRGRDAALAYPGWGARPVTGAIVARGWAVVAVAGLYVRWSSRATFAATLKYKEAQLMGLLLAVQQLVAIAVLAVVAALLARLLDGLRSRIARVLAGRPRLAALDPLGHALPAVMLAAIVTVTALLVTGHRMPQLRPLIPWRWMLDGAAAYAGAVVVLARLRRPRAAWPRARRRRFALASAGGALVLVPTTLLWLGGDVDTKGMAITASPLLDTMIGVVRTANDLDRDGFGSLLGENDCAPLDKRIHPGARDVPDNGVDENCNGRDSSLRDLVAPAGEHLPVPPAFQKPWNVLLVTIDTVRYDHTTFGGYKQKKGRDTTPRLAELVDRAVSFTFANAPSAGTMASVPAILTSKFFHSGIALDENRKPHMPPKLKAENTTLPEIMKRGGYTTGAILSHEYFNDWGMDQGVDHYDNDIGKTPDAFRVSSNLSTDRAIAWISSHARDKWFLWVHYLDPHGRYVAHPDGPAWGDTEEDLYDGEIRYTDQHLGRLFDELARLPGADRTIVIITSDHGDGFNEHGFTNHGQALYRELLHVPLIIAIPDLPARQIGGAVSPLDIVPTVADLCGIDVSDLSFEGRSLVPQLFYGKEDDERVVFSETNYPKPLRAAVSARWKLIYDLQNNLYQLFDLKTDPWEKTNLASKDPTHLAAMKEHLDGWLERVMFARDKEFNQAAGKVAGVLLDAAPTPKTTVPATSFDDGAITLLGWQPVVDAPALPGAKTDLYVYFRVDARPSGPFKLQASAWPTAADGFDPRGALGKKVARSSMRVTADGYLPSDRWRPGEFIRERFTITFGADWGSAAAPGDAVAFGVTMQGPDGKVPVTGQVSSTDPTIAVLGTMPLAPPPPPGTPTPGAGGGTGSGSSAIPGKVGPLPAKALAPAVAPAPAAGGSVPGEP